MATNTSIIDELAQIVGDPLFSRRSKATWGNILTDAQNYIVEKLECTRKIDASLVMVASTPTYSLPSDFIKIPSDYSDVKEGAVAIGTTGKFVLRPTDPILLNHKFPDWRGTTDGTPEYFYILRETASYKLGLYPEPSAAFLTTNGTTVRIDEIFRPGAISYNASQPFDDSNHLSGLQFALKLHARMAVALIDKDFATADRLRVETDNELKEKADVIGSVVLTPGEHGFVQQFG